MSARLSQLSIPLECPRCYGKMMAVSYDPPLRLLKERCWQVCKSCGFERNVDDFKKELSSQ